jgi:streptomycin 6-kinase
MGADVTVFEPWLARWDLEPDGEAFQTPHTHSHLLPVRQGGVRGMLKIATEPEEGRGAALMAWWAGDGAAPVLARQGPALLLLRAQGRVSLAAMACGGQDSRATEIICAAVAELHRPRPQPPPAGLVPLALWFRALSGAAAQGGTFASAWAIAGDLLEAPEDVTVLHGDVHHDNILDFGPLGFLTIDPKGLIGERGYDYANIFKNPNAELAASPGRMAHQLAIVARLAGLERDRMLRWIIAHAGLSAAWWAADGYDPTDGFTIIEIALALLRN